VPLKYFGNCRDPKLEFALRYLAAKGTLLLLNEFEGGIQLIMLNRFFSLHFILPFIILFLIILFYLFFLHETGSKNPLGVNRNFYKIPFNIYFTLKDLYGFMVFIIVFIIINLSIYIQRARQLH